MKRMLMATVLLASLAPIASAQTRSWNWYGEMVSVDQGAKAITVKAMTEPQVGNYFKQFKAGDKVVLIWSVDGAKGGDAQTVLAIASPDEMKMVDVGYITRVDFVSGDTAAKTITFKTVVPDAVLKSAASVQAGKWLKVTAPMDQPGPVATLASAMPTEKPAPKPPKPKAPSAAADAGGRAAGGAVAAKGGISGAWTIALSVGGNTIESACDLAQDGTKLGGTCAAMGGDKAPVTGTVEGTKINFSYEASLAGNSIELVHTGTLDSAGTRMSGSASLFGMEAEFTGTKK